MYINLVFYAKTKQFNVISYISFSLYNNNFIELRSKKIFQSVTIKMLEYKEYHTNADNFKLVTKKGLEESFIVMSNIIQAFEYTLYPKTQTLCEPMLSNKLIPFS